MFIVEISIDLMAKLLFWDCSEGQYVTGRKSGVLGFLLKKTVWKATPSSCTSLGELSRHSVEAKPSAEGKPTHTLKDVLVACVLAL